MEGRCYCCGKKGHMSNKCKFKDKPKAEWSMNKTPEITQAQHVMQGQLQQSTTQSKELSPEPIQAQAVMTMPMSWMGNQVSFVQQGQDMKNWILLDNQSSVDLFCNPELVEDIHETDQVLDLKTNAGSLITNKKATVPGYGEVWYDSEAMTNVFSLAKMQDMCKVEFVSGQDSYFSVTSSDGKQIKFKRGPENLYYFKPTYRLKVCMVETVKENETFYTKRQIKQAKKAQTLLHTLGCPTVEDLKNIV